MGIDIQKDIEKDIQDGNSAINEPRVQQGLQVSWMLRNPGVVKTMNSHRYKGGRQVDVNIGGSNAKFFRDTDGTYKIEQQGKETLEYRNLNDFYRNLALAERL